MTSSDFEEHVAILSILFLCFRFFSLYSRLWQALFLLMRTTQISKAVLSHMMIISRGLRSVLYRRRINRPRVWVYPAMVWRNINVVTKRHIQKLMQV